MDKDSLLSALAKKYVWWQPPGHAAHEPRRIIAQLMDIGDFEDIRTALNFLGDAPFADAIAHAQPGWFRPRSWSYWHYRLGLIRPGSQPPPLPERAQH